MRSESGRRAFTLFELMVVLVILGILVSLLMPALYSARAAARRVQCVNNFRQLGIAIANYESMLRAYPPAHTSSPRRHNLLTFVLPQLGLQSIQDRYDWSQDWNSRQNLAATQSQVSTFRCPASPADVDFTSDYAVGMRLVSPARKSLLAGGQVGPRDSWNSILQKTRSTPDMVTDGLSNSMMLFEDGGRPLRYVAGARTKGKSAGAAWADVNSSFVLHRTCRNGALMNCRNDNEIYSFHQAGCNFLFGDSSVRFVDQDIHPETFVSLFTRDAGDLVVPGRARSEDGLVSE